MNKEILTDLLQNKNFVMFLCSVSFMCGILAYFTHKEIAFGIVFTAFLIIVMYLKFLSIRKTLFLLFLFYFGFFVTSCKIKETDDLYPLAPINTVLSGRIVSIPTKVGDDKYKFFLDVEKADNNKINGKAFVSLNISSKEFNKLNIGQKISINGNLRHPFYSTNPSQFDYSSYLKNFGVFTILYSQDEKIKIINEDYTLKWKFLQQLNATRNRILKVHSKYLKSPYLEILGGIVFGEDAVAPPKNIKQSFAQSGLLHILAASGMNVAFIFSFWVFILGIIKIPYKIKVFSGMLVIILYTMMTGLGSSVVRASLMILFVLAGKLMNRDAQSVALLAFVGVLMLIYNPAYINDVSFQMSFLVTLGLILCVDVFSNKLDKIPNIVKVPILIPIVAQIWIAPVQMFYFNTFSLYSVFANILSSCLVSIISFGGFVSSIINVIPCHLSDFICKIFDFVLNYFLIGLINISEFFSNLPNCIIETIHPEIFQIIFYYLLILIITFLIKYEKYKYSLLTIFLGGLILFLLNIPQNSHPLEVIAFDVQNADSFMIKTPQNKYFFIDTGKLPYNSGNSQAKIIMLKYLKDHGIKNIEGIVVTHFDNDHSGGTVDFIENVKVKTLYLNSRDRKTQTAYNIFKTANEINQNIVIPKNNEIIYSEPDLKIINFKADIDSSNESSIITLLHYKNFDMLFMGDAGVESFNDIKTNLPHNIEVFKVGHHGGPFVVDENMVKFLNPQVSIISTGINYYGHPVKGTLDLLRKTEIFRTDIDNSIKINSNGENYNVSTYNPKTKKYQIKSILQSKISK